jgi:pyruvate dehydrogenase E2 component (dihydrolipoamide acetyltransferase)
MTATTEFRMPSLGADMESGVLLEWLVHPGDTVHKGDVVAVVDTSKAAIEVEIFATGVVEQLLVQPGARVPVGEALATIAVAEPEAAEAAAPSAPVAPAAPSTAGPPAASVPEAGRVTSPLVRKLAQRLHVDTSKVVGTGDGGRMTHADVLSHAPEPLRIKASPLARRTAAELGVALETLRGTGPGGAITVEDVKRAAPSVKPQGIDAAAMRKTIAALMARSKKEIPHYYLTEQVDMDAAMGWLRTQNQDLPVSSRIVPAALLLKAAALAAATISELNGFWIDGHFRPAEAVHLGVAVSLRGGGLVAPAIHDADHLTVTELMAALRDLVARTRAGRLRGSEMADPTITVSNLGEQGVESILGVIYPPQVALVGFGRIAERPWAIGGLIGVRPIVTVSLAGDHRATDGATGARYLQTIAQLLQRPEEL